MTVVTPPPSLQSASIGERLAQLHDELRSELPGVGRVAIALHDAVTGRLRTFAHSTAGETPLARYEQPLADLPYLTVLARDNTMRVIDDLAAWPGAGREHTRRLLDGGYRSSLTAPLVDDGTLLGFVFFDSTEPTYFTPDRVLRLRVFVRLAAATVGAVISRVRMLRAAVRATRQIGRLRDEETGTHLERISRYARLIALELAERRNLDDEYVAFLTLFAPLHDIGKIGVPDRVLRKPARLEPEEFRVMQKHVEYGKRIIDTLAEEFSLTSMPHVAMLRNLVMYHHEADDGSGYPLGLAGNRIPLEARIVRVADVFDALTSARVYKKPWTVENALTFLAGFGRSRFDRECIAALVARAAEVAAVHDRFADPEPDANGHEGYSEDL